MPDDQLNQGIHAESAPLQTICPRCRGRGLIQHRGRTTTCSCPAGYQITMRDMAATALTSMFGSREATRWLTDWHAELGDRPVHLLGNGQASRVMDVIGRLAAERRVHVVLPEGQQPEPARQAPSVPSLQDTGQQRMVGELRTMGRLQAAELLVQGRLDDMTDDDRAHVDALMFGTGFLVDGQRVDPGRVQVIRHAR